MFHIESFLSARLFLAPQLVGDRIYFLSNLSGHLSLYVMNAGGSVPEPLLPPNIALQNPDLIGGKPFQVFPRLNRIVVMIDSDGDENYRPVSIPLAGGFPEPVFEETFRNSRAHLVFSDVEDNLLYFQADSRDSGTGTAYRANLASGEITTIAASTWGCVPIAETDDHQQVLVGEFYTMGDAAIYQWTPGREELELLHGVPMDQRQPGQVVPLSGINSLEYAAGGHGLLAICAIYNDSYGPAYLDLARKEAGFQEVRLSGVQHSGSGELVELRHLTGDTYLVSFNIDGASWLYQAVFDSLALELRLERVLVGASAPLSNGMLESYNYDKTSGHYILSFSTATSPSQIYSLAGEQVIRHTHERVLGIADGLLSPGEDASYVSHDGLRVSARLYLPSPDLGFAGPRPLVYYIHGGPQSQERPDFAWFSMPLIQYLTLNGFAVFVPNVRGSTGYGLDYTKRVDRDWGGLDRLDHVAAMRVLAGDARVDVQRAGVVGRSYGGYMTLTMAARHPELWSAAVDMFGPFDLLTFLDRVPESWKPYMRMAVGDPERDHDLLVERSPRTHIDQIRAPLLVIQGKNDPRVVERESRDLVEYLREKGHQVEYLMFENEGHDVLKYENRVRCYTAITDFFKQTLKP